MSRRKRSSLSPSLFPFLAVLVCTLGTLILLLALVAKDATTTAKKEEQPVAPEPEAAPAKARLAAATVSRMIAEEQFLTAQYISFRDKQTAELETRREERTHLETQIAKLRDQLKSLSREVDSAVGAAPIQAVDDATLIALRSEIEKEREAIEELKTTTDPQKPRIVIVPHKGPNGTDRRAIYLECDAGGLTIWPEGTRISLEQLERSDTIANPLDASLRVVRQHAMQTYGDATPPYPLLVVRPDGIESYGAARKAMDDWDDQFGYELIPAQVDLAFDNADPNLKQRLERTVADAVAKQSIRDIAGMGGRGGGGGGGGYGPSGATSRSGTRPRVLSAASLDRQGKSNGFHDTRGNEDYARSPYTSGSQAGRSYGGGNSYARLSGADRGGMGPGAAGSGNPGSGNPGGIDPQTEKRWADQMQSAAGDFRGGTGSTGLSELDAVGSEFQEAAMAGLNSARGSQTPTDGTTGGDPTGDGLGMDRGQGDRQGGGGHSEDGKMTSNRATSANSVQSTGTQGTGGSRGSGTQGGATAAQQSSSAQSASSGSPAGPSAGSPQAGAAAGNPPRSEFDPSMSDRRPPDQRVPDSTLARELVKRGGRNWAMPREMAGAHGNAIIRTIRVQCYGDRFVLLPPSSGGATEMFGFSGGDVNRASLELATSVRDRIARWGVALPGGRWQPRLSVEVMPDGRGRFEQLQRLLDGSGVEVIQRNAP